MTATLTYIAYVCLPQVGQRHDEPGPRVTVAHLDGPAVRRHNGGGDGEPQARAAGVPVPDPIGAVEPVEDPRAVLRRDAGAVVGDGQLDAAVGRREGHVDPARCV